MRLCSASATRGSLLLRAREAAALVGLSAQICIACRPSERAMRTERVCASVACARPSARSLVLSPGRQHKHSGAPSGRSQLLLGPTTWGSSLECCVIK